MMIRTSESSLTRDLLTLGRFIKVYCDGRHGDRERTAV
jgi:hypothetical protein